MAVFIPVAPPAVLEKSSIFAFSLYLATPATAPHESFITTPPTHPSLSLLSYPLSLSLLSSFALSALCHIRILGWIRLPRWGMLMRKYKATSGEFLCWDELSSPLGWVGSGVWGCFHISAPQPQAEDAAGLVLALFFFFLLRWYAEILGESLQKAAADESNICSGDDGETDDTNVKVSP